MNMLVLARKYNDIFYAISTDEWEKTDKHYLLMITDRLDIVSYPMENMFDGVYTIHSSTGVLEILKETKTINKILSSLDYDIVTTSNLAIVVNMFVINNRKTKKVILLEDGIMNYYDFKSSRRLTKLIVMAFLGINERKIQKKITCTYLLSPDEAVYYFGEKKKLQLKGKMFAKYARLNESLRGKSIFVGQNFYVKGGITIKEYSDMVNRIIKENKIDYYLPHTMSKEGEDIKCEIFDVLGSNATLEIYASVMDYKVFSFSSSVLYTSKLINPNIKAVAIKSEKASVPVGCDIIYKNVDEIIQI